MLEMFILEVIYDYNNLINFIINVFIKLVIFSTEINRRDDQYFIILEQTLIIKLKFIK